MSVPTPVPLDQPSGSPEAVAEAAADARAAAVLLDELAEGVAAARLPSWRGADAGAVAERCAATSRLAGDAGAALHRAAARLASHAELWTVVRMRIEALRSAQDDDFAVARSRVAVPHDPADPLAPPVDDVLARLAEAEEARQAEHAGLVAQLADDADATRGLLTGCLAVVGATGRRGTVAALEHLADRLPGWGMPELAHRGRALAVVLRDEGFDEWESAASDAVYVADDPVFAREFLSTLGPSGVRLLLLDLDHVDLGERSAIARVLAAAFGAAVHGDPEPAVREVLEATYVDPDDPSLLPDQVARGLAVVALAGAGSGRGPHAATLGRWARQMLTREAQLGPMSDRLALLTADERAADPVLGITSAIAAADDAVGAADLLRDREVWTQALERTWVDGGAALRGVVGLLADAPAAAGGGAVVSGLQALGWGLADGHPDGWSVDRHLADLLAPEMAAAVAAHVGSVADLLVAVVDRCPDVEQSAALLGLGLVVTEEGPAETVRRGIVAWQRAKPLVLPLPATAMAPAIAVPAAFVAVREHGQRLSFALRSHETARQAELRARRWQPVGLVVDGLMEVFGKRVPLLDPLVAVAEVSARTALGATGRFEVGRDSGRRFDAADATAAVLLPPDVPTEIRDEVERRATDAFRQAHANLPEAQVAESEKGSIWEDVWDEFAEPSLPGRASRRDGPVELPERPTAGAIDFDPGG